MIASAPATLHINLSSPLPWCASVQNVWEASTYEHQAGIDLGLRDLPPLIASLRVLGKERGAYQGPIYGVLAEFTDGSKSPVFTNGPGLPVNSCAERSLLNWLAAHPNFKDKKIERLYLYQSVGEEELPEKANFPTPCAHCRHELLAAMQRNELINEKTEIVVTQIHENTDKSIQTRVTTVGKLLKPYELLPRGQEVDNPETTPTASEAHNINEILKNVREWLALSDALKQRCPKQKLPSQKHLETCIDTFLRHAQAGDCLILIPHKNVIHTIPLGSAALGHYIMSGASVAASIAARFQNQNLKPFILIKGDGDGILVPPLTLQRFHDLNSTGAPLTLIFVTEGSHGFDVQAIDPSSLVPDLDAALNRGRATVFLENTGRKAEIKFSSQLGIEADSLHLFVLRSLIEGLKAFRGRPLKKIIKSIRQTGLFSRKDSTAEQTKTLFLAFKRAVEQKIGKPKPKPVPQELTVSITVTGLDPQNPRKSQTLTFTNPTTSPPPDSPHWDALYKAISICYQALIRGGTVKEITLKIKPGWQISHGAYHNLLALLLLFPRLETNCNVVFSDGTQTLSFWRFAPLAFVQFFNPPYRPSD